MLINQAITQTHTSIQTCRHPDRKEQCTFLLSDLTPCKSNTQRIMWRSNKMINCRKLKAYTYIECLALQRTRTQCVSGCARTIWWHSISIMTIFTRNDCANTLKHCGTVNYPYFIWHIVTCFFLFIYLSRQFICSSKTKTKIRIATHASCNNSKNDLNEKGKKL